MLISLIPSFYAFCKIFMHDITKKNHIYFLPLSNLNYFNILISFLGSNSNMYDIDLNSPEHDAIHTICNSTVKYALCLK